MRDRLLRLARAGERLLPRLALAAHRRPRRVGWLALVIVVASLFGARDLRLDADLSALLPNHFASVRALARLEDRAGAAGYVVVVAEGDDQQSLRRYAERLAPELDALESIHHVELRRPRQWLLDHRLQIAPLDELEAFTERLEDRIDWEVQSRNPLFFDLEGGEPPELELTPAERSAGGRWFERQTRGDYYEDAARGLIAVLARPHAGASDFHVAARTVADVERVVTRLGADPIARGIRTSLTGRYQKQVDQKAQIQRDLGLSSALALLMVLVYLAWYFRRLRALVELGLPLLIGLIATFGIVGATFGQLNVLTAFIGAILLGLGIDHGIHLLSSYEHHRRSGLGASEAIERAFSATGRAVTMAGLTTMAGFLGLALSEFQTFRQFGIVAAAGMLCILAAYLVGLPALLRLSTASQLPRSRPPRHWRSSHPRLLLLATSLTLVAASVPASRLSFDADFSALQDSNLPSFRLDEVVNDVIGHSQTPTLILTESAAQEQAISQRLRDSAGLTGGKPTIDMVVSLADLLDDDPSPRAALVDRIRRAAARVRPSWLDRESTRREHARLLAMTRLPPVTRDALPPDLRWRLGVASGKKTQGSVLVFPAISLARGDEVLRYADDLRRAARGAPIAGEAMVLADILETVKRESRGVLAFALVGVFLTLWALERRLRPTLIALASATLTLAAALGMLVAAGGSLNYLNMVVIPVLFGIAVDGAVHLVEHVRGPMTGQGADARERVERPPPDLGESRRAIGASLVTTALGFGALLLADHPGLRSLGLLALLGLAANAVVSLWLLPAALSCEPGRLGASALPHRRPGW